jgi:hypothetical protein
VVEPGRIDVMVGASSEDIRLEGSFVLTGRTRTVGSDRALTSVVVAEPIG